MSDILGVHARTNAANPAIVEYYDNVTKRTVLPLSPIGQSPILPAGLLVVPFSATLAQVNAGFTFIAADSARTIYPVRWRLLITGAFLTLTDVRLSDTNGTPVDIATILQAQLTNGAIISDLGGTGITLGAGYGASLTAGAGVQIRKTGTAGTGGTSISGLFEFILQ